MILCQRFAVRPRVRPSAGAEQLCPRVGRAFGRGRFWAAGGARLTTDALVVFHHPAAGLSVGESGKLQGSPSPLRSLPALSGADSASPQTHCVKIAPRLAALIHTYYKGMEIWVKILKSSQADKTNMDFWSKISLSSRLYTQTGWDASFTPLNLFQHDSYIQQRGPDVFPEFRLQQGQTDRPLGCTHSLHGLRVTLPRCCLQALV